MDKWLTYSPVSGHGNATITLSASTLTGLEDRIATLIATGSQEGHTLSATTVVTQKLTPLEKYLTFNISSAGTINWKTSKSSIARTIEYKLNNGNWVSIGSTTTGVKINVIAGDIIQFRGNNTRYADNSSDYNSFNGSTASFEAEGNIMSLINSTDFSALTTLESDYTFCRLFYNCSGLVSAENLILPATTLANICYESMFQGCTSLTTAPELPAMTLAERCYDSMFSGCTLLASAPELPANTLAERCYSSMFTGCKKLTIPTELPATTLANYCYDSMFSGCTSLTTVPALPATALTFCCYNSMFKGCKKLTTAPSILPATTLAERCYNSMFQGCTLLASAPELPATTLANYCYTSMFAGCTSLNTSPELPSITLAKSCYQNMFYGCTKLTTAPSILPATTLANSCYESMFRGCTKLTIAPSILPATTLAERCYDSMFMDCSLTTAPELPANTLVDGCYSSMFRGCNRLNYIKCLATDISAPYCTDTWVSGVASTGTFVKNPNMTSWRTGSDGIPRGWTVVNNS